MNSKSNFLKLMSESSQINVDDAAVRRVAINSIGKVNLPKDNSDEAYNKFFDDVNSAIIDNVTDKELSVLLLDEVDYCKASKMTPYRVIRSLQNKITNHDFMGESMRHNKVKPIIESFGYENYANQIRLIRSQIANCASDDDTKKLISDLETLSDDIIHEMKNEINGITISATSLLTSINTIAQKLDPEYKPKDYSESLNESVMVPVPTNAAFVNYELQPLTVFALFGKDKKPLLSSRGIIITSKMSETFNQDYANQLYGLIDNLKEVYVIDNEKYDEASGIRTDEDFYKFVKDNGELIKWTNEDKYPELPSDNTLFDDTDFIIQ